MYYSELIGTLDQPNILDRCQDLIQLLPKIYNNDHITIINACYNTAITTNKAKIILYRSKKDETISNAFQLNISNEIPIIEVKQILSKKVNIG